MSQLNKYDGKRGTAITMLRYYMRTSFEENGLGWDEDNNVEMEEIVDGIIAEVESRIDKKIDDACGEIVKAMSGENS